jgi:hypothetical protein
MTSISKTPHGEMQQYVQNLHSAGFTLEVIRKINKSPAILGDMLLAMPSVSTPHRSRKPSRFAQYNQYLNPLSVQLAQLREYNSEMPNPLRIPYHWFRGISTSSRHVQSIEDLEVFVVWRGTLEKSWYYAEKLIELGQPAIRNSGFETDAAHMRFNSNVVYWNGRMPAIYRVRINLVAHWSPGNHRSVDDVYEVAIQEKEILASFEAVSTYALQAPGLIQQMDGINLPFMDSAGISCDDDCLESPNFMLNGFGKGVSFGSAPVNCGDDRYAAAVLQGVPERA